MRKITFLITMAALALTSKLSAQATSCTTTGGATNYYITSNAGWTTSEFYKIIDIDAEKLTDASLPQFSTPDGRSNAADADFKSGHFKTPIYTTTDGITFTPTSVLWPINYYMAAFAPTMYTSAYTKLALNGLSPSGTGATTAPCTLNDNSVIATPLWGKKGFIELSRLGSTVLKTPPSRHGYIEIDSLPAVERIQWSYSSTSWKRGVKADVNYHDGKGWQPLRWVASDYSAWEGTFTEQGYQFEEIIGKQDDPSSYTSFRIRIWDGDSIHMKVNANDLSLQAVPYTATMVPYDTKQTVRVHQIKVYSGAVPTVAPQPKPIPTGINSTSIYKMYIYKSGNQIVLSDEADVELYSIDGRLIYSGFCKNIDISNVPKGTYIVKAINDKGVVQNSKIMI